MVHGGLHRPTARLRTPDGGRAGPVEKEGDIFVALDAIH